MSTLRKFIQTHLLAPLKQYPTTIQDTLMEIITQRLEELYDYTRRFPEILSPNQNRMDILKAIADQFLFSIREDADIEEQIAILDRILYVYSKRGSVDTIENMWKYYGGNLPREVQVIIPSYNLFRYSISALSGNHVYQDNSINRTGVYEIKLINNYYPIPDLKEFLLDELVAAGNYIYFTNALHMDISQDSANSNPYLYNVYEDNLVELQLSVLKQSQGFTWSGYNALSRKSEDSYLSGRESIYLELSKMLDIWILDPYKYDPKELEILYDRTPSEIKYPILVRSSYGVDLSLFSYCTPTRLSEDIYSYLYNSQNGEWEPSEDPKINYKGYFILGVSKLGEEVI